MNKVKKQKTYNLMFNEPAEIDGEFMEGLEGVVCVSVNPNYDQGPLYQFIHDKHYPNATDLNQIRILVGLYKGTIEKTLTSNKNEIKIPSQAHVLVTKPVKYPDDPTKFWIIQTGIKLEQIKI